MNNQTPPPAYQTSASSASTLPSRTPIVIDLTSTPYTPSLRPTLGRSLTTLSSPVSSIQQREPSIITVSSTSDTESEHENNDTLTSEGSIQTFNRSENPRRGTITARKTVAISEPSVFYQPNSAQSPETGPSAWLKRRDETTFSNELRRRSPGIGSSSTTGSSLSRTDTFKRKTITSRQQLTSDQHRNSSSGVGSTFKK